MGKAADLIEQAVQRDLDRLWLSGYPLAEDRLELIMKKIRRRTRVVGAFPDGQSCLNLATARLRYIAGTTRSAKMLHE
jgi:putative transposase